MKTDIAPHVSGVFNTVQTPVIVREKVKFLIDITIVIVIVIVIVIFIFIVIVIVIVVVVIVIVIFIVIVIVHYIRLTSVWILVEKDW